MLDSMFALWKQYGKLMNNMWNLRQDYLLLIQTIYLYKQDSNLLETSC